MKEYMVGEVFRYENGKVYQCVEFNDCRGCAFSRTESCTSYSCLSEDRNDGKAVQYIEVTEPVEGMLYRAEDGSMYRLMKDDYTDHPCVCDVSVSLHCTDLDKAVFGDVVPAEWYWAPVVEDATSPVEPLNCWRAGNHG